MIVNELWAAMKTKEKDRTWANPVRLSNTGKCPQALAFQLLGFEKEPLEPRVKLLFRVGDHTEAEVKALMELHLESKTWAKFHFGDKTVVHDDEEPRVLYKQIPVCLNVPRYQLPGEEAPPPIPVWGHVDGIGWKTWDTPYLIEIKSSNDWSYERFAKGELDESYQWQVQAYMQASGLKRALVIFMKKSTSHLAEMIVERDETYDAAKRWQMILSCDHSSVLPQELTFTERKKAGGVKIGYPCSYCDYKKYCFVNMETSFDAKGKPVHTAECPASQEEIIAAQEQVGKMRAEAEKARTANEAAVAHAPEGDPENHMDPIASVDQQQKEMVKVSSVRKG